MRLAEKSRSTSTSPASRGKHRSSGPRAPRGTRRNLRRLLPDLRAPGTFKPRPVSAPGRRRELQPADDPRFPGSAVYIDDLGQSWTPFAFARGRRHLVLTAIDRFPECQHGITDGAERSFPRSLHSGCRSGIPYAADRAGRQFRHAIAGADGAGHRAPETRAASVACRTKMHRASSSMIFESVQLGDRFSGYRSCRGWCARQLRRALYSAGETAASRHRPWSGNRCTSPVATRFRQGGSRQYGG